MSKVDLQPFLTVVHYDFFMKAIPALMISRILA